jgi:hypothetical protein
VLFGPRMGTPFPGLEMLTVGFTFTGPLGVLLRVGQYSPCGAGLGTWPLVTFEVEPAVTPCICLILAVATWLLPVHQLEK